jgi:hypothetical protein
MSFSEVLGTPDSPHRQSGLTAKIQTIQNDADLIEMIEKQAYWEPVYCLR